MPKHFPTKEEIDAVQQPLDNDGWSNDRFDELYGKDKNPHIGTKRDRKNRKMKNVPTVSSEAYRRGWERALGKKKNATHKRKV